MVCTEEQQEKYKKARDLNDFNDDPKTNPFKSKYESRKIIQELKEEVISKRNSEEDSNRNLRYLEAALEYNLGVNFIYTEETAAGVERLKNVLEIIEEKDHLNPAVVSVVMATYNELGVVWSAREGAVDKSYDYLSKAEKLYEDYKEASDAEPLTVHNSLDAGFSSMDKLKMFEALHTHTLYFLAQAYKSRNESDKSALYCLRTLRRQLESGTGYDKAEWSVHMAGLSQYYVTKDLHWEARHCLACSQFVIEQAESGCEEDEETKKIKEKKSDIARCWVKYCRNLLEVSKQKYSNDINELDDGLVQLSIENSKNDSEYKPSFEAFSLETTSYEDQIPYSPVSNFDQAKTLFTKGKHYADEALKEFILDGYVTDHIEINQDISRLYQGLVFFEKNSSTKCKLHKRRIDLIQPLLDELNPQYYLAICRQLQFELAEIYADMMDLKYRISVRENSRQNVGVIRKINHLCQCSIKYYGMFLSTMKASDGSYPSRFELDCERPSLVAHFCTARLYSKLIPPNMEKKREYLRKSFENYNFVVNYAERNEQCVERIETELQICRDFVQILPSTLGF